MQNGWMHTGDGGFMDEDGFVYIADRIKDMIISGGEKMCTPSKWRTPSPSTLRWRSAP